MMKRVFLLACAAWIAFFAVARDEQVKQWSDGMLQWSDFKGLPTLLLEPSSMVATLDVNSRIEGEGSRQRVALEALATMHCEQSAADTTRCTSQRLRYHQLQFDLLEYYRRRLQDEINNGSTGIEVEKSLKEFRNEYRTRCEQIARETSQGTDDHRLQDWEYTVRRQLDELGLPPVPRVSARKWNYGIYGGVGAEFPTGQLHDNFGASATFQLGLTGGYRDLRLKADIAYGQPGIRNANVYNVPDSAGFAMQGNASSSATHLMVGVQLGYTVLRSGRLSITPNVGMHYSVYSWELENYSWYKNEQGDHLRYITSTERRRLHSCSWMASIDFDVRLASHVNASPILGGSDREQFTSNLRITPWVARASYDKCDPAVKGYSFGFTVAYLGLARLLSF
ncbi:MAG: autotransporter outer membrane beta-barrel domain-containing protein [Muribaculaceae bacterium]|nr:autotransporter outer membrane beta-barrel domain-containing protein [Muribaculaceae bacterium]